MKTKGSQTTILKLKASIKTFKKAIGDLFRECPMYRLIVYSVSLFLLLFLLDYCNQPTIFLSKFPVPVLITVGICLLLFAVAFCLKTNLLSLLKVPSANLIDTLSMVVSLSCSLFICSHLYCFGWTTWLLTGPIALFDGLTSVILIVRLIIRYIAFKQIEEHPSYHLIDLKDLYENTFNHSTNQPILISEKASNYDLFQRTPVINHLYDSITCPSDESFVISLEGPWGSGKTTILNNVKQKLSDSTIENRPGYVVIDDFDPWLFGNQEALLMAMFETLLRHADIKYQPFQARRVLKQILAAAADCPRAPGVLAALQSFTSETPAVAELKHSISSYLRTTNKTFVFFIDNLDRANDENIVFLFKVIGIILDLPGVVYVLSFESNRIDKVLHNTHEFDPRFKEKIIQQEIKVPEIGEDIKKTCYRSCILHLLTAYGVSESEQKSFEAIISYITAHSSNIRQFKHLLNSVFSVVFCIDKDNTLNKFDLLTIEIIHFFDYPLYEKIRKNPRFFISSRTINDFIQETFDRAFDIETFSKDVTKFFSSIFSDSNTDTQELLAACFPMVSQYKERNPFVLTPLDSLNLQNLHSDGRICRKNFFIRYFTYGSSISSLIKKDVSEFIPKINQSGDNPELDCYTNFKEFLDDIQLWISAFDEQLQNINEDKRYPVCKWLSSQSDQIKSTSHEFLQISKMDFADLISHLLKLLNIDDLRSYLTFFDHNYKYFSLLFLLQSIFQRKSTQSTSTFTVQANMIAEKYAQISSTILTDGIDLYRHDLYQRENIWGLYKYCEECDQINSFTSYMKTIISKKTVYRFLWDIIFPYPTGAETMRLYHFNSNIFSASGISFDDLNNYLAQNPPVTEDQRTIKDIYDKLNQQSGDNVSKPPIMEFYQPPFNPQFFDTP